MIPFQGQQCKGHCADIWRRPGAKHCSSLCSQSEGGEYYGGQARAENPTKSCPRALAMFATCSWPSLCEQSELQCWRRNKRLCGSTQISAARVLPPTFYISSFCTLMFVCESGSRDERIWEQRRTNLGRCSPKGIGAGARAMFFRLSALFPADTNKS